MPKVTNESYSKFLHGGFIDIIEPAEFQRRLETFEPPQGQEFTRDAWKQFCFLLYWTGRRPVEILRLRRKDIEKKGAFLSFLFETAKGGRATVLYFNIKKVSGLQQFWDWVGRKFSEELLFGYLSSGETRTITWKTKLGETHSKNYVRPTKRLFYHIKKGFGVPPYFFRHNRFSDMARKGAKLSHIKHQKGAKTMASVEPYIHMSEAEAKEASKFVY